MKKNFPESELIINADGSCFHLHLKPEQLEQLTSTQRSARFQAASSTPSLVLIRASASLVRVMVLVATISTS